MSLHQAQLFSGAPERTVLDPEVFEAFEAGELDLADALGVEEDALLALRQQAISFLEVGQAGKAQDVVLAVIGLGRIHPVDPLTLAWALRDRAAPDLAEAARLHAQRLELATGIRLPALAPPEALREYLPALESYSVAESFAEWEQGRRLGSALASLQAFAAHLSASRPVLSRVEAALKAVGPSEAQSRFPRRALQAASKLAPRRRPREPLPGPSDTMERLQARLGPRWTGPLQAARARGDQARFDQRLLAFVRLLEQATATPSYCVTRMGWHYPERREDYRHRQFLPAVVELSEGRWMHSEQVAEAGLARIIAAKDPVAALEAHLVERFFLECGHDLERAPIPAPSVAAIEGALEAELLAPLRALNETILDFELAELGSHHDVRRMVDALMQAIARDGYRHFELFWASKLNSRAGGFDVAGHELLRQLGQAGGLGAWVPSRKQE